MSHNSFKQSRRKLLKSVAAGSGAVIAGKSLPETWTRPVVDAVLLPAHATSTCQSICEIAQSTGVHTTLVKLLSDTGLLDTVCSAEELTVWAPTDAAFEKADLGDPSLQEVKDLLLYHTASGTRPASEIPETIGPEANVTATVPACNGVVHVIDEVLLPGGGP